MSYFYHDDEEDYYHGGTGLQGLKTTFESGKEKFTLDDESDDDDSPQFAGSFQAKRAWGGAPATTKAPATRPKVPKPKQKTEKKQKISLREAFGGFGGGENSNSDSDASTWSDDEEDIFGGGDSDSDSDVSDEDVKKVMSGKKPKLNNVESTSLNRYKKLHVKSVVDLDDDLGDDLGDDPGDDFPKLSLGGYGGNGDDDDDDDFGGSNASVSNPFDW